jgi:hypothetical protein
MRPLLMIVPALVVLSAIFLCPHDHPASGIGTPENTLTSSPRPGLPPAGEAAARGIPIRLILENEARPLGENTVPIRVIPENEARELGENWVPIKVVRSE